MSLLCGRAFFVPFPVAFGARISSYILGAILFIFSQVCNSFVVLYLSFHTFISYLIARQCFSIFLLFVCLLEFVCWGACLSPTAPWHLFYLKICSCLYVCLLINFHRRGFFLLNETINVLPESMSAIICCGNISVSRTFVSASKTFIESTLTVVQKSVN